MNYVMVALVTNVRRLCVLCKVCSEAEERLINETVFPARYGMGWRNSSTPHTG